MCCSSPRFPSRQRPCLFFIPALLPFLVLPVLRQAHSLWWRIVLPWLWECSSTWSTLRQRLAQKPGGLEAEDAVLDEPGQAELLLDEALAVVEALRIQVLLDHVQRHAPEHQHPLQRVGALKQRRADAYAPFLSGDSDHEDVKLVLHRPVPQEHEEDASPVAVPLHLLSALFTWYQLLVLKMRAPTIRQTICLVPVIQFLSLSRSEKYLSLNLKSSQLLWLSHNRVGKACWGIDARSAGHCRWVIAALLQVRMSEGRDICMHQYLLLLLVQHLWKFVHALAEQTWTENNQRLKIQVFLSGIVIQVICLRTRFASWTALGAFNVPPVSMALQF